MQDFNLFKQKFLVEELLIKDYKHWHLSLRPDQVTLGALIISVKEPYENHTNLPPNTFQELGNIFSDCERILKALSNYSHINFLSLRMIDNFIHFHVFPRYEGTRNFNKIEFLDNGFPGTPDLSYRTNLGNEQLIKITNQLRTLI